MDKELQSSILKARVLSSGSISVILDDEELFGIVVIILRDLNKASRISELNIKPAFAATAYFEIDLDDVRAAADSDIVSVVTRLSSEITDFFTYFKCLCELHKRRKKFSQILKLQPLPTMEQVAPRALIEFKSSKSAHLRSWLTWRKWLYDIDNRSAQETGYIFEPIIAAALGGAPFPASKSPIKRTADPAKGRQVDCIVDGFAYEFKMRVTIAASGQGRFKEELDFAEDCYNSGYKPALLVLDPTPSNKYSELKKRFEKYGGQALSGEEAWSHIAARSGESMKVFIEKYVKTPLEAVERGEGLQPLSLRAGGDGFEVSVGTANIISRRLTKSD